MAQKTRVKYVNKVETIACPYANENTNGWIYAAIPKIVLEER